MARSDVQGRGSRLDYWAARPACGCIAAWMTWASTEEEVGEFARNMKASGRDVIRGSKAEYIDRLDRCPHQEVTLL